MTTAAKRQIAVGVITTLLAASLIGMWGWTSQNVIFRPEFMRLEAKLDRVLDVVCADKPNLRQCQP